MPTHILLLITIVSLLSSGCLPDGQVAQSSPSERVIAFVNVNVIPMDSERVLERQTVLVRDGIIAEVGSSDSVAIPANAIRIDGGDRYLLPGLTDFHVHLRSTDELLSYLAYGVTSIVHVSGGMSGAPDILRYREELEAGSMLGPFLYASGPILDGDPPIFPGVSRVITTPEEARKVVADQSAEGYDFIKVYNNLTPDVLTAVVEEAHARGMAVIGHIPRKAGRADALQRALDAGLDVIAHGEEYFFTSFYGATDSLLDEGLIPHPDVSLIPEAVRMTQEAGTAVVPNLSFVAMTRRQLDDFDSVLDDPEARYLHPDVLQMWREQNPSRRPDLDRFDRREQAKYPFIKRLTRALNDAGVPLMLGTDASAAGLFPGKSAHLELFELVDAGLSPYDALATGTRTPGEFIQEHAARTGRFGVVAPGFRADLILVQHNPLEDIQYISGIKGVMVRGRWMTREELETLRSKMVARYTGDG